MVAGMAGSELTVVLRWAFALLSMPARWLRLQWHIYISVKLPRENGVGDGDVVSIAAAY